MAMFGNNNRETAKENTEQNNSETRIGKGATLTGDIETHGNIRLDGRVNGNIRCKARVVFGEGAKLKGNLMAQNAEVFGEVEGKVEVTDILTLKQTAVIKGDIVCNKFVVETGATFNGKISMGNAAKDINFDEKPEKSPIKHVPSIINENKKLKQSSL